MSGLPEWIKFPFERFNFEDFACPAPETSEFISDTSKQDSGNEQNNADSGNAKRSSQYPSSFDNLSNNTQVNSKKESSLLEACLSAGTSSAEATPSATPQNSPCTTRRVASGAIKKNNSSSSLLAGNAKRWFYPGFLTTSEAIGQAESEVGGKSDKNSVAKTGNLKFHVTNFDINAVGPCSW